MKGEPGGVKGSIQGGPAVGKGVFRGWVVNIRAKDGRLSGRSNPPGRKNEATWVRQALLHAFLSS